MKFGTSTGVHFRGDSVEIKNHPVFYPKGKPYEAASPSFSRARGIGIQLRP
jgi:hypothetical protein